MRTMLSIALVATYVLSLTGCGGSGGPTTYSVTGSVSLGGSPIEEGSIVFDPADGRGGSAMGGIKNGQFTAKVPAGEKILRISAVRTTGETRPVRSSRERILHSRQVRYGIDYQEDRQRGRPKQVRSGTRLTSDTSRPVQETDRPRL
jgi:hypothetical protein